MMCEPKEISMKQLLAVLLLALIASLSTNAQLVPKDAVPEKVAEGYKFTEGPALGPDGCIYFTDIPAELILKFDPESGETTTVIEASGRANGLMFRGNTLFFCAHGTRTVGEISKRYTKRRTKTPPKPPVLEETIQICATFDDKKLNSPNDLAIDKRGNIYFTDPRYGNRDSMEMDIEGVYFFEITKRIDIDLLEDPPKNFMDPVRIDADLTRPNGIILSPDESILYVADNGANYIYAYDIEEPGKVKNKRVFGRINDGKGGGSDGMTVDKQGRLYATGHGKVWVYEPTGQLVATIDVGRQTTNCTFGADGKTLYVTANKGLYRIKLDTDAPLAHAETKLPFKVKDKKATLTITENKDAELQFEFEGHEVSFDDLTDLFTALNKMEPDVVLAIQPEENVKWQVVVDTFTKAVNAGIENVGFAH
jgi:gluconolactonase